MRYLSHTEQEVAQMLEAIGVPSLDQLFDSIPPEARFSSALAVPKPLAEPDLMAHLRELSGHSRAQSMLSFLGAGMYAHHVPPAVDQLLLRSEFYTAYTPYQPEVAQGTLQAVWEFQTMVSEILGLPLANASIYDGASAAAEAALMARRLTGRRRVVVSKCVHPDVFRTIKTYLSGSSDDAVTEVAVGTAGTVDLALAAEAVGPETAALVVGYPSFFGPIPDLRELAERVHAKGALLVTVTLEPYALALVEPPGKVGADIAVAEGQPIACPPQFGGPGVGLFACRDDRKYLQQLPGRVAGETVDVHGQRGFVLTLSTREQHIRRERATSNICTNQGLIALAFTIRASLLGKSGFVESAQRCLAKAHYLRQQISTLPGFRIAFPDAPLFNEFAVSVPGGSASAVTARLEERGIIAGFDLGRADPTHQDKLLIAVVETHTRADLDRFIAALATP